MKGATDLQPAIMAESGESGGGGARALKQTKIIVYVEEAIDDLLVVSFAFAGRLFQGVLLDAANKNAPHGLLGSALLLSAAADKKGSEAESKEAGDRLYSVSQRHTYMMQQHQQGGGTEENESPNGQQAPPPRRPFKSFKDRQVRTMRLRPRQVLCSKCRSICNENSENVQIQNAIKSNNSSSVNALLRIADNDVQQQQQQLKPLTESPPPPLPSFPPAPPAKLAPPSPRDVAANAPASAATAAHQRMALRKRRFLDTAIASGDDEAEKRSRKDGLLSHEPTVLITKTSPVIKISFGPQGQGTVLKIPPRSHTYTDEENAAAADAVAAAAAAATEAAAAAASAAAAAPRDSAPAALLQMRRDCRAKAARKALKKAKKEAHRKAAASLSPLSLHHHKSRHHKHKFKHKRRHREEQEDDEDSEGGLRLGDDDKPTSDGSSSSSFAVLGLPLDLTDPVAVDEDGPPPPSVVTSNAATQQDLTWNHHNSGGSSASDDSSSQQQQLQHRSDAYSEIKKECLRQKLSISLKRLSAKAYMRCTPAPYYPHAEEDSCNSNSSHSSSGTTSSTLLTTNSSDSSASEPGDVPEFPETDLPRHKVEKVKPLMMRISSHNVRSCTVGGGGGGGGGRTMAVGDIVWGKIHGFPWWPGKVLSIMVSQRDNGLLITQQAHVAWFGSSTSSYMPCSQLAPFLESFKSRYNKKKRGPYKEAIKQATLAAQQVLHDMKTVTVDP